MNLCWNFFLDKQLKEVSANLILARHECSDREQRSHYLQNELDNLQEKYEKMMHENNTLSMKVGVLASHFYVGSI